LLKAKGLAPENVQELTNANQRIAELTSEISLLMEKMEPYNKVHNQKERIVEAYRSSYIAYRARYQEISTELQARLSSLSLSNRSKEITFEIEYDSEELFNAIVAFVKHQLREETLNAAVIRRIIFNGANIEHYITNIATLKLKIESETGADKHSQLLRELIQAPEVLEQMVLRLINDFYNIGNIRAQTKLGGKLLRNTSFGERCAIVVSIIIAAGTNPILIDQPEDHLDGRFIAKSLVPLIRRQKHNRQIILITRDANIVIGGDAELINILEETSNKTEIIPSTIENITHRAKYIWVLDGGEEAFKKREQKYSIMRA
jgi:hypothetical protein